MTPVTPHSTGAAHLRETLVGQAMDSLALNLEQSRRIYNPSEQIDSALEHLQHAARLTEGPARQHILAAIGDILAAEKSNRSERGCEQEIAATAETIGSKGLTVKDAARRLRDPLAVLVNPILTGARRNAAYADVLAVIGEAREGLLFDGSGRIRAGLRGELNSVAKATAFEKVVEEAMA